MKHKFCLLLIAGVLVSLISCTKDSSENHSIVGKWRLTEIYNGYANGGSFIWESVAATNSHLLEFTANGQYFKKDLSGFNTPCSGTYQILSNDLVEIISTCQTGGEKTKISELTDQNLILDYSVREGVIRYKYIAEK